MPNPATPTYWLEPTSTVAWGLRRYSRGGLTCEQGHHASLAYHGRAAAQLGPGGALADSCPEVPEDDPRWPTECGRGCGYRFTADDEWQNWFELIYRRADTGAEYVLHAEAGAEAVGVPAAPPGGSWNADWMTPWLQPDGICLVVRLPNGHDWMVDGEASNCDRKGQPHQCWVRHGDPRKANVTVDKAGDTCSAGAGSIAVPGYHGFLRAGVLTAV